MDFFKGIGDFFRNAFGGNRPQQSSPQNAGGAFRAVGEAVGRQSEQATEAFNDNGADYEAERQRQEEERRRQEEEERRRQEEERKRQEAEAKRQAIERRQQELARKFIEEDEKKKGFFDHVNNIFTLGQNNNNRDQLALDRAKSQAIAEEMERTNGYDDQDLKKLNEEHQVQARENYNRAKQQSDEYLKQIDSAKTGMKNIYSVAQYLPGVSLGVETIGGMGTKFLGGDDSDVNKDLLELIQGQDVHKLHRDINTLLAKTGLDQGTGGDYQKAYEVLKNADPNSMTDDERQLLEAIKTRHLIGTQQNVGAALGTLDLFPLLGKEAKTVLKFVSKEAAKQGFKELTEKSLKQLSKEALTSKPVVSALSGSVLAPAATAGVLALSGNSDKLDKINWLDVAGQGMKTGALGGLIGGLDDTLKSSKFVEAADPTALKRVEVPEATKIAVEKTKVPEMVKSPEIKPEATGTLPAQPESISRSFNVSTTPEADVVRAKGLMVADDGTIMMESGVPARQELLDVLKVKHDNGKVAVQSPVKPQLESPTNPNVKTSKMSDDTTFMPDYDEAVAKPVVAKTPEAQTPRQVVETPEGENIYTSPTEASHFQKEALKRYAEKDAEMAKAMFEEFKEKTPPNYKFSEDVKQKMAVINSRSMEDNLARANDLANLRFDKPSDMTESGQLLKYLGEQRQNADEITKAQIDEAIVNLSANIDKHGKASAQMMSSMRINYEDQPAYIQARIVAKNHGITDQATVAKMTELFDSNKAFQRAEETAQAKLDDFEALRQAEGRVEYTDKEIAQMKSIRKELKQAHDEGSYQRGEIQKLIDDARRQVYKENASLGEKIGDSIGKFGTTAKLSDVFGRVRDNIQTNLNRIETGVARTQTNLINSGLNLFRKQGDKLSTFTTNKKASNAEMRQNLKRLGEEHFAKYDNRKLYVESLDDLRFGRKTQKTAYGTENVGQAPANKNRLSRGVQGMVESAPTTTSDLISKDLRRLLRTEAVNNGIKGKKSIDTYVENHRYSASPEMMEQAKFRHDLINNTNETHIGNVGKKVSNAIDNLGKNSESKLVRGAGSIASGVLRNFNPFIRFGSNMVGNVVENGVLGSTAKAIGAFKRGNVEAGTEAIGRGLTRAEQYAVAGLISNSLQDEDRRGKDYSGKYVGNDDISIPVQSFGTNGQYIGMGDELRKILSGEKKPAESGEDLLKISTADNLAETPEKLGTLLFGSDYSKKIKAYKGEGSEEYNQARANDLKQVGAGLLTGFIPAFGNSINSVLNPIMGIKHDPKTNIRETDPETGKEKYNLDKSLQAQALSRIPFLAQQLERDETKNASNPLTRITQATVATDKTKADKAQAEQAKQDQKKALERFFNKDKNGNFTEVNSAKVEIAEEEGAWEQLAELKRYQMSEKESKGELTKSARSKFETEIKRYQKSKELEITADDFADYKSTTLTDWRNMANPNHEDYDPDRAGKLKHIDELLTKDGVSFNNKDTTKHKYYHTKKSGGSSRSRSGRGGSGSDTAIKLGKDWTPDNATSVITYKKLQSQLPQIQKVENYDNSRLRKISVKKGIV